MKSSERVVVLGGSIGGLATALALKGSGRTVTIVERDPPPPDIAPEAAFTEWQRPGVPQFRHAHILLARLQTTIRDNHPEFLEELHRAGIVLSNLKEVLPPTHTETYQSVPGDEDLLHLWGRRPTFEYVLRRHVGQLPHVTFVHSARVDGFLTESSGGTVRVRGLQYAQGGERREIQGDVVVDASGKHTKSPEWLAREGVRIDTDRKPSEYVYVCRHYRLRDQRSEPPRHGTGGNLDYLWYGTFYAEHGHFAVAFACPIAEKELADALKSEEGFNAVCRRIDVLDRWTRLADSTSKVLGAGRFENRWFCYGARGGADLIGYFAVGDALAQTNPMYGRGCSAAFVQAHTLAETLDASADPKRRARYYDDRTRELLRQHFDFCVMGDRMSLGRAKQQRGLEIPLGDRIVNYLYERAWVPAMQESPLVARELLKAMQMRDISGLGLRLQMVAHVAIAWLRQAFTRKAPATQFAGPPRQEILQLVSSASTHTTSK